MEAATFLSQYPKLCGLSEEEEFNAIKETMVPEINSSSKDDEVKYKRPVGAKSIRRELFRKKGEENKESDRMQEQHNFEKSTKSINRLVN